MTLGELLKSCKLRPDLEIQVVNPMFNQPLIVDAFYVVDGCLVLKAKGQS